MDDTASPSEIKPENQASKKRKTVQRTVVKVRIGENVRKLKNEGPGPPSDYWSWRKYGQKPIKGSPYPRGYYKCSTSKGCSAKKQVERCRTDASTLIITYTSTHNHPSPDLSSTTNCTQQPKEPQTQTTEDLPTTMEEEEEEKEDHKSTMTSDQSANQERFHYLQSPIRCPDDIAIDQEDPFKLNLQKTHDRIDILLEEEEPICLSQLENISKPKSEELDFFDELEELPITSSFFNFMRSNFSDERISVVPSS